MLMLISVSAIAQNAQPMIELDAVSSSKSTVADQTTQIINTVFDKTTEAITELASALKVPAEHVYSVLMKQQLVISLTYSIITIFLFILGVFLISKAINGQRKANDNYNKGRTGEYYVKYDLDDNWWLAGIIAGCVILVVDIIAFISMSGDIVTGFINPEYGALHEILKLL